MERWRQSWGNQRRGKGQREETEWTAAAKIVAPGGPGPAFGPQTPLEMAAAASTAAPNPGTRSAAAALPFPPSPNRQFSYIRPLCSCPQPSRSLLLAAAQCLTHLKELHNPSNAREKRRKEEGRRREGAQKTAAAPLVFEKEPVAPRAANEASSSLSNARRFLQNVSSGTGWKANKRRSLQRGRRPQPAHSSRRCARAEQGERSRHAGVAVLSAPQDKRGCPFACQNQGSQAL